jgi:hypothetical protein
MGLMLVAQESMAGLPVLGLPTLPSALPLGMGGVAGVAVVGLIVGIQLIKRKK